MSISERIVIGELKAKMTSGQNNTMTYSVESAMGNLTPRMVLMPQCAQELLTAQYTGTSMVFYSVNQQTQKL